MIAVAETIPRVRRRRASVPGAARSGAGLSGRSMTVGELLTMLAGADPQSPVVIRGQYGGYDCVHSAGPQPLKLNVNTCQGFGPHEVPQEGEAADIVALAIECASVQLGD
jgi:hypothetical protein